MKKIDFDKEGRKFKKWCRENRLRLTRSEDGYPEASAIGRFKGQDKITEGHEPGFVGVVVGRDTKKQFTFLNKKLIELRCEPIQVGDFEGGYKIKIEDAIPVAKLLKIVKGKPKVKNPKWLAR